MTNTNTPQFVDLDNAREDEQRRVMEKIIEEGHCPFCPENLTLYHKLSPEIQGKYWTVTKNQWPYKNTKFHYLAILKRHAEMISELEKEEGSELVELLGKLEKKLKPHGGAFALRFGDTAHSAGTVRHLHAQYLVPDIDQENFEPIRFKIGKDKKPSTNE